MFKPVQVKALPGYRLWVQYSDGTKGEIDLSHLVRKGVFALWNTPGAFEGVYIGSAGQIAWSEEIDICPDAVYIQISGSPPETVFPNLATEAVSA